VICLPQSFGPFRHAYQARLAAWLMARCAQVMLRDPESLALYARHAPRPYQAQHVPDVAFTLALRWPGQPDAKPWPPRIGATVVDWSPVDPQLRSAQARYEQGMAELLAHAVTQLGTEVRLFVQCQSQRRRFESDLAASQRVWAQARQALPPALAERVQIVDDLRRPEQAAVAYGQMSAFIATRLHSAIIAASQGTPVLAIGYQPKTLAAMRLLGQAEYSFDLRILPADLAARLDALWAARAHLGAQAARAAQRLGRASADALRRTIAAYLSR
jgi:colanic acid/amylovoran biosynthesis protein